MSIRNMTEAEIKSMLGQQEDEQEATVKRAKFLPLTDRVDTKQAFNIGFLGDVNMEIKVELGEVTKTVRDILNLEVGNILSLNRLAGEHVDIYVNNTCFAAGEMVVINDVLGARINALKDPEA